LEFRKLAYELANRNGLQHPFSSVTKIAGIDWARGFLSRYAELSLRKPEATSMSRLTGFNKVQVTRFFDLLKCEISKLKVTSKQVFNIDETGITTVQVPGRILARKGSKQVGRVVSAERGTTTTVVCAMSASGTYVPPMFLFKRKNMNNRLMNNCTPGAIGLPSPTGWIDTNLFVRYLQHFVDHVKPSESNPVLVLLDGHQSHKSIEAIQFARDNHMHLLTIPPHTSHKLQPLDLTFFGPLKTGYNREIDKWMLAHPGQRVTDYDLCEIFSGAYQKVATIDKATKGFRSSGIFPYNPDVFCDEDYAPATVTEQQEQQNHTSTVNADVSALPQHRKRTKQTKQPTTPVAHPSTVNADISPEPQRRKKKQRKQATTPVAQPECHTPRTHRPTRVSVVDISPLPRASCSGIRKRKAESSSVITSSPYKAFLESKKKKAVRGRGVGSKCAIDDSKKLKKKKTETKVRQERHSGQKKSRPKSTCRSKAVFPRSLESRMPLPRKPLWLQKKNQSGNMTLFIIINQ